MSLPQVGSLFFWLAFGYAGGLVSAGLIAVRIPHSRIILISASGVGFALIGMASARSVIELRAWAGMVGFLAGLYLPSGVALIVGFSSRGKLSKALALHDIAPNLSLVLTPIAAECLLGGFSWREILKLTGVVCIIWSGVVALFGVSGREKGNLNSLSTLPELVTDAHFLHLAVLFALAVGATVGVYSMLPLYLVNELDVDRQVANALIAFSRIPGTLLVIASGWIGIRFGTRRVLKWTFLLTAAFTFSMGVLSERMTMVMVFLQPTLIVLAFPLCLAEFSRIHPMAVSIAVPFAFVAGAGVVPALIGYLARVLGFPAAFMALGGSILVVSAAIMFSWSINEHADRL